MEILSSKILYKGWSTLSEVQIEHINPEGETTTLNREIYNSGNGATALLYNLENQTVILTRQFRLAASLEGHPDGYILEACAGMLDDMDPETAIKKEILEETGYQVDHVDFLFNAYATPGAHTEKVAFFLAPFTEDQKQNEGGGLDSEHEDIEVLRYSFDQIREMLHQNQIEDAKTLILLQYAIIKGIL